MVVEGILECRLSGFLDKESDYRLHLQSKALTMGAFKSSGMESFFYALN